MPLDDTGHAVLMGLCPGSLTQPGPWVIAMEESGHALDERPICPVCDHTAGVTQAGLVGHHVQAEADGSRAPLRSIYVDPDDKLIVVEAANTNTPGVLIGRVPGAGDVGWQLFHAPTALCMHEEDYFFDVDAAIDLSKSVGLLGDWLRPAEEIQRDHLLGLALGFVCFTKWKRLDSCET